MMTACSVRRWAASTAGTISRPDKDRVRVSRTVDKSPPMGSIVSRASRGGFGAPESRGLGKSDLPNRLRRITDTLWVEHGVGAPHVTTGLPDVMRINRGPPPAGVLGPSGGSRPPAIPEGYRTSTLAGREYAPNPP